MPNLKLGSAAPFKDENKNLFDRLRSLPAREGTHLVAKVTEDSILHIYEAAPSPFLSLGKKTSQTKRKLRRGGSPGGVGPDKEDGMAR